MNEGTRSPIFELSNLLAKEHFRMQSSNVGRVVIFGRHDLMMHAAGMMPRLEVWCASSNNFIDGKMQDFFSEVIVYKMSADSDYWSRVLLNEKEPIISFPTAMSSYEGAVSGAIQLKQEDLSRFLKNMRPHDKINKNLFMRDIGNGKVSAYVLKNPRKSSQNFAVVSFGLTEKGKEQLDAWKRESQQLTAKLRRNGNFTPVTILADPMKRGTVLVDPDDIYDPLRRNDDSFSNDHEYDYDSQSEGIQTTIVPGNNPTFSKKRNNNHSDSESSSLSDNHDESTCSSSEVHHHHHYDPSFSSPVSSSTHGSADGKKLDTPISTEKLSTGACSGCDDLGCHCHGRHHTSKSHHHHHHHTNNPHRHHHEDEQQKKFERHKNYMEKLKETDAHTRTNYIAKMKEGIAQRTTKQNLDDHATQRTIAPGGPKPARGNPGYHKNPKPRSNPTHENPPLQRFVIEDSESSSSSDDFEKLLEEYHPQTATKDGEDSEMVTKVVEMEILTETGAVASLAYHAADRPDEDRFAESRVDAKSGIEFAFIFGGKRKLSISMLNPVFMGDTIADLGNDRSYTARLALRAANNIGKVPDFDIGRLRSGDRTKQTARVQMFAKREGSGILTKLKNFFSGNILNRRLDEELIPVKNDAGNMRIGIRSFQNLDRASAAYKVPHKSDFLQRKVITRSTGKATTFTGSSFQTNIQVPDGKNKQDMYFLRMDTDTPTRVGNNQPRGVPGSAETGFVWYRPETKSRVGIILVFSPDLNPERSVLMTMYVIYRAELITDRGYDDMFLGADSDAFDEDGDGGFDD
jgi:hypothetical protein